MKIWCLFSVDNNYDQPDNNLVCWWSKKPSLEELAKGLGVNLAGEHDEIVVAVVSVWSGKDTRWPIDDTHYRLEEVEEGVTVAGRS